MVSRPADISEALAISHQRHEDTGHANHEHESENSDKSRSGLPPGVLEEIELVKDFGDKMKTRGVWEWWRKAMGFTT